MTRTLKKPCKSAQADDRPCLECACCKWWLKHTGIAKAIDDAKYDGHDRDVQYDTVTAKVSELSEKAQASVKLTAEKEKLVSDNKQCKKTINELRAKSNGIKTTTAVDRPERGTNPPGRPKGCKATINKRPENIDREEILDGTDCPDCGGPLAETSPETIDKVVTMVRVIKENVLYKRRRRWCKNCKKLQAPSIPDVQKYARRSSNHTALTVSLNMNGMSHARAARHSKDVIKLDMSRSAAYRDKISHAKQQEPFHAQIRQNVLAEPVLGCDEFCTTVPRDKRKHDDNDKDAKADDHDKKLKCTQEGRGLVALGKNNCLVEVSHNRRIGTLEKFLPDYSGLVIQDSYAGWLHIGNMRQLCMSHQICIVKEDIKYGNHKGDVLKFLQQLLWILRRYYDAHKIEDPHTRMVAARCLDERVRQLVNGTWKDVKGEDLKIIMENEDESKTKKPKANQKSHPKMVGTWNDDAEGTIYKYKKRLRREGFYLSTFLYVPGIKPDNNKVERMNRIFKCILNDGGGNRSERGMHPRYFSACLQPAN